MDEINFKKFLEKEQHTEKSITSRIVKARKGEKILKCTLDNTITDDDKMYNSLIKLKMHGDSHSNMQNALRKYYLYKKGKEFPKIGNI